MNLHTFTTTHCPVFLRPVLNRVENSPIGKRLAKGVFWSMAGSVISRGLMLVASILVARILGKEVFGEYGMIRSTVNMFAVFAGFGMGLTATKHVAEFRVNDQERAGRVIGISGLFAMLSGGLMAAGLFLFAPWLAEHTINAPHLTGVLRIGALILFINAINGAQTGALSGFEAFKTIAHVNFFVGLISFPILTAGAYFGGLTGAVWALAINLGFHWLLNHIALRKEAQRFQVPFSFKNCRRELPLLWNFALPAALAGAIMGPLHWACNAMLVSRPDGYGEMGIYNASYQWCFAILFLPHMLKKVFLPLLSNLNGEPKRKQYLKVFALNLFVTTALSLVLVVPLILFAPYIVRAYGSGFEEGVHTFRILMLTAVLMAGNNVVGQAIASKGNMWYGLLFHALWGITLVVGTFLFLQNGFGALGLALAMLIAYLFNSIWQGIYLIVILSRKRDSSRSATDR